MPSGAHFDCFALDKLLTLPDSATAPLSIRAKALVFHDPASQALLRQVERVAHSDATVLVTGETGTGKELIARHVHTTSGRRGPFVAVNCGAFSETLIDAELFGHEAGAFTGATHARPGWFEAANGGTLFLDEIGDLPLALQVKLLRVLQERQVTRLGSRRAQALDVRLVAGTNIDLARAVEAQHFRADLYYRLSVASVHLPALRDRPGDILPLARHFIGVYSGRLGLEQVTLTEAAQSALLGYAWPGNIRELENVIHYALIVCRDSRIRSDDLRLVPVIATPSAHSAPSTTSAAWAPTAPPAEPDAAGLPAVEHPALEHPPLERPALERLVAAWEDLLSANTPDLFDTVESALIHAAFAHARRNQVRTAKALGITRNMLRTQLKRHGLLASDERAEERADAQEGPGDGPAESLIEAPTKVAVPPSQNAHSPHYANAA